MRRKEEVYYTHQMIPPGRISTYRRAEPYSASRSVLFTNHKLVTCTYLEPLVHLLHHFQYQTSFTHFLSVARLKSKQPVSPTLTICPTHKMRVRERDVFAIPTPVGSGSEPMKQNIVFKRRKQVIPNSDVQQKQYIHFTLIHQPSLFTIALHLCCMSELGITCFISVAYSP